jgi:hypothetical protein
MLESVAPTLVTIGSCLLFAFWFRRACLLILVAKAPRDYAKGVAIANQLTFPEVQAALHRSMTADLRPLRDALDRDFRILSYAEIHRDLSGEAGSHRKAHAADQLLDHGRVVLGEFASFPPRGSARPSGNGVGGRALRQHVGREAGSSENWVARVRLVPGGGESYGNLPGDLRKRYRLLRFPALKKKAFAIGPQFAFSYYNYSRRNPVQKNDRRCEPRAEADCGAGMRVLDSLLPTARFIDAQLAEVSDSGLQLKVGFIFPNEQVQIRLNNRTVVGEVRYCVSAGDDFRVGIRLAA